MSVITRSALLRSLAVAALVFVGLLAWRMWSDPTSLSSGPSAGDRARPAAPAAVFTDVTTAAGLALNPWSSLFA